MTQVAILGAGDMGMAMLTPLAGRFEARLWGSEFDTPIIHALRANQPHPRLGVPLAGSVRLYEAEEASRALEGAEVVVLAVSSPAVRPVMEQIAPFLDAASVVVLLSKGLDQTGIGAAVTRLSQVAAAHTRAAVVAVGGPGIAREVALGVPTTAVFASDAPEALELVREVFTTPAYLVETSADVAGVELAAALKNPFAMSFGIVDGIGRVTGQPHANLRAALFPQALRELQDLVVALGGRHETVMGQAGLGDLQVTAAAGRNRLLGERIGAGAAAADAARELQAAGITTEGFIVVDLGFRLARDLCEDDTAVRRRFALLAGLQRIVHEGAPPLETLWDAVRAGVA